jgi:hypothetical protein
MRAVKLVGVRSAASPAESALDAIQQVHQLLPDLLAELAAEETPSALSVALENLGRLLNSHFESEESPGGLFDELGVARPANGSRLASLRREHGEILESLTALRDRVREVGDVIDGIRDEKLRLLRRVRSHERKESRLMMDTYLVDEGGPG